MDEVLDRSQKVGADPLASIFSDSILALGRYASTLNEPGKTAHKSKHEAQQSLVKVLDFKRSVQNCSSSLLKLQVRAQTG